jgi:hypothetical protein
MGALDRKQQRVDVHLVRQEHQVRVAALAARCDPVRCSQRAAQALCRDRDAQLALELRRGHRRLDDRPDGRVFDESRAAGPAVGRRRAAVLDPTVVHAARELDGHCVPLDRIRVVLGVVTERLAAPLAHVIAVALCV